MIYDSLKHLEQYEGIFPRLYRGLELLRTTDFSTLEDKLYEVEGRDLFFSLQSYDSKPANDTPEAHRDYTKQYTLSTPLVHHPTAKGGNFLIFGNAIFIVDNLPIQS